MLARWDDYTIDLHQAAVRCANGACAAIKAGEFWPPNDTIDAARDECAALFHHGGEDSVEWRR
jgi:ATP-dependent helicase/nuclease subunit B